MNINGRRCTNKEHRFVGDAARLCLACLLLLNAACTYRSAVDKPLVQWSPAMEQRVGKQLQGDRSTDLAVLVSFSGGGTRASAFAYGVLQELAATEIRTAQGSRPLLHEIDMISSVSGGSFTAAYYGLPWLHLVDGGISDNLGMRAFYDTLSFVDDPAASARDHLHLEARRIIIISVNA